MFFLQIGSLMCVADARACPRVLSLMYPSRTRAAFSVLKTRDGACCRSRRRVFCGLRTLPLAAALRMPITLDKVI
jgi:hypothetical protein